MPAHRVEDGVHSREHQVALMRVEGLAVEADGFLGIPQSLVHEGEGRGRDVALAGQAMKLFQAMPPGMREFQGPDAMRAWLLANQRTFPDYHEEIEMLVGEGDCVAWRSLGTGTQAGPMGPFPATGRRMSITIIGMLRGDVRTNPGGGSRNLGGHCRAAIHERDHVLEIVTREDVIPATALKRLELPPPCYST